MNEAGMLEYYERIAEQFEDMHSFGPAQQLARRFIIMFAREWNSESILDVGCGTGLGIRQFLSQLPGVKVKGVEPSEPMLEVARKNGTPDEMLVFGSGYELPFQDGEFDIVTSQSVLHHVERPDDVILEMLRVAKQAVFINDNNRFGYGGTAKKLARLAFYKMGMAKIFAKGPKYSEGDGVYWSYSIFDSLKFIEDNCSDVILIPTNGPKTASSSLHWNAKEILVIGLKPGSGLEQYHRVWTTPTRHGIAAG